MPRKRSETPFDKILSTGSRLRLYVEYGDAVLEGKTEKEFIEEIAESFHHLLSFRNMVNSLAALDRSICDIALDYLPANND